MVSRANKASASGRDSELGLEQFARRPHPSWLKEGVLAGTSWLIETDNPELRRHASRLISFEIPVAPDRMLTDPSEWRDLLTAKIYVHGALTGPNAWVRTASTISEEFRGFVSFLRWRNERGLPSMSLLTPAWFEEFCESLQLGGLEGLVRSKLAAIAAVERERLAGRAPPPQATSPSVFSMDAAAKLAGFDSPVQLSDDAAKVFADWALSEGLQLTKSVQGRIAKAGIEQSFCGHSLDRYTRVWQRLSRLKGELSHDPIGYMPFQTRAESVRLAAGMGMLPGRTRTPPPEQICFLIDRALRWVLFYSDDIMEMVEGVKIKERSLKRSPKRTRRARLILEIWQSDKVKHVHQDGALAAPDIGRLDGPYNDVLAKMNHLALRMLPAACAIIIAAFSARRIEEILSLRDDSIEYEAGEPWLRTYVVKTLRGREKIPVADAVVKAVKILNWLSASAREATETHWIFQAQQPLGGSARVYKPVLPRALSLFAQEVDVPALADGTHWAFAPHQFRRFFAIVYYYRYRYRSLTALSQYLVHYDPDSTRAYVTEARMGGFLKLVDHARANVEQSKRAHTREALRQSTFEEVAVEFRVEIYRGALAGTEHVSGWAGQRIVKDLQQAKMDWERRIEIGSYGATAPTLDEILVEFAKATRLEPNGQGHSYCSCGDSEKELDVAGCVQEARRRDPEVENRAGPDLRFAADVICAACTHNVQLAENRDYWERLILSAHATCNTCPGTVLAEKMAERIALAEGHLDRFHRAGSL